MSTLSATFRERIKAEGPIPLADFMGAAAAAYYARGTAFGADGDFTTAPEISQVFGEILGLWMAITWQSMGQPAPLRLIELGPGRGTLMADAVRASAAIPACSAALDIHLVETSPALRDRQRAALGDRPVTWHDDLSTLPDGPAIVFANEFFDALPIIQLERTPDGWHHRAVDWDEATAAFVFCAGSPASAEDIAALGPAFADADVGTIAERSPATESVVRQLAAHLASNGGAALIIDYGYAKSAPGDTLQALRHHAFAPPLESPGEVDLTAHVDFERLLAAATDSGARTYGPLGQGRFLATLGAEARANALMKKATPEQALQISSGVHRLIHPTEMGTLFKVAAIAHPALTPPPGFEGASTR